MEKRTYKQITRSINSQVNNITKIILLLDPVKSMPGYFYSKMILIRLNSTFSAIKLLLLKGHNIEIYVLYRFIQEQIAYAYSLANVKNNIDIDKVSVTKSITKYKARIEHFGKMYNEMSNFVHLGLPNLNSYSSIINDDILNKKMIQINITHDDNEIDYGMIWSYASSLFLYLDILFFMIGSEDDINPNYKYIKKAERIEEMIYLIGQKLIKETQTKT